MRLNTLNMYEKFYTMVKKCGSPCLVPGFQFFDFSFDFYSIRCSKGYIDHFFQLKH